MSFSSFPTDRRIEMFADASVVINLNATGDASRIIRALPNPLMVTEIALGELRRGSDVGHDDAAMLEALVDDGLIQIAPLPQEADDLFRSLIGSGRTLHDGESATICCALDAQGIAILDERKARSVCVERFAGLPLLSTSELLLAPEVEKALGRDALVSAVMGALTGARMRVPAETAGQIVTLIGHENAKLCTSLPRHLRQGT